MLESSFPESPGKNSEGIEPRQDNLEILGFLQELEDAFSSTIVALFFRRAFCFAQIHPSSELVISRADASHVAP